MSASPTRRVVFLDLDHTLLDNQKIRDSALCQALQELSHLASLDELLRGYDWLIVHCRALENLGLPNPRHYWNPPEAYALLIAIWTDRVWPSDERIELQEEIGELSRRLDRVRSLRCEESGLLAWLQERSFPRSSQLLSLPTVTSELAESALAKKAVSRYRASLRWEAHAGVRETLEALREEGIVARVLSEGLTSVQVWKIEEVGLADLLDPIRSLMTTEQASWPKGRTEIEKRLQELAEESLERGTAEETSPDHHTPTPGRASLGSELTLLWLVTGLLERFSSKSYPEAYGRFILAEGEASSSGTPPGDALAATGRPAEGALSELARTKITMIGDRHDKDIAPLLKLVGPYRARTIRLRWGKYAHANPDSAIDDESGLPSLTCTSFEEVKSHILDPAWWEVTQPIGRAPLFPSEVVESHESLLELGLSSSLSPVRELCALALADLE